MRLGYRPASGGWSVPLRTGPTALPRGALGRGMTWTYSDEMYRDYTRRTWDASAAAYTELMRRLEPFRQDLVRAAQPRPGERVLDIATGQGEPALTLARLVGPAGRVLGIDLSARMVELARAEAARRGAANAAFEAMDAEALGLPDHAFDLAVSAFGFQIVTQPERAAGEALRVLAPGGRLAVCVWSTGDRAPVLDVIIAPMLAHAEPDEGGYLPTPYELGGPGEMVAFLERAGFEGAREERFTHAWHVRDAQEYFDIVLGGSPLGHSLREEAPEVQERVLREARANLARYARPDGIELPGEHVVVTARRPR
jgi:ubiquinone/menaquinone biosynthesis C-methylase UbiE